MRCTRVMKASAPSAFSAAADGGAECGRRRGLHHFGAPHLRVSPPAVPVIARVNGYALGAGLEVAAACDLRIASSNAVFGMPEVRVGIPSWSRSNRAVPGLIGWGRTRELLLRQEHRCRDRAGVGTGRAGGRAGRARCRGGPRGAARLAAERRPAGGAAAEEADPPVGLLTLSQAVRAGIEPRPSAVDRQPKRMMSGFGERH